MKNTKKAIHEPGDGTREYTARCIKCNTVWEAEEFFKCCPTCGGPLTSRTFRKCTPLALLLEIAAPLR
jgi:rRNA maturation endonuclease Nob1